MFQGLVSLLNRKSMVCSFTITQSAANKFIHSFILNCLCRHHAWCYFIYDHDSGRDWKVRIKEPEGQVISMVDNIFWTAFSSFLIRDGLRPRCVYFCDRLLICGRGSQRCSVSSAYFPSLTAFILMEKLVHPPAPFLSLLSVISITLSVSACKNPE